MTCLFLHLPENREYIILKNPPTILINAKQCSCQKSRQCKAGVCCLGTELACAHNRCFNKLKICIPCGHAYGKMVANLTHNEVAR
jgi:hypothetical protein